MLAEGLSDFGWPEWLLVAVIFFNGVWNTSVGSTGGIAFASLSAVLSPTAAITVQSVVEGVSASYRSWSLRGYISRRFLLPFVGGGVLGVAGGYGLISTVLTSTDSAATDNVLRLVIAGFILASTWLPIARLVARRPSAPAVVGGTTSFVSLFVGGLGAPISASVESRGEGPRIVIATATAAVLFQYAMRLVVFGLAGFDFGRFAVLVVALTAASLIGTVIGKRLLIGVDPAKTRAVFRIVVSAIALSLVVRVVASVT